MISWVGEGLSFEVSINQSEKFEANVERMREKIEQVMRKAWVEGVEGEDVDTFREVVDEGRGRKLWVSYMNARRASGNFRMTEEGFRSVGELMNIVLDACAHYFDTSTTRSVIILSQTFHDSSDSECRNFLQSAILAHSIWRTDGVWDEIVKEGIESEFEKQRMCGAEEYEGDRKNVVFTQLSSFTHVMTLFGVESQLARRVIEKQCLQYSFTPEERDNLLQTTFSDDDSATQTSYTVRVIHEKSLSFEGHIDELPDEPDSPDPFQSKHVRRGSFLPPNSS